MPRSFYGVFRWPLRFFDDSDVRKSTALVTVEGLTSRVPEMSRRQAEKAIEMAAVWFVARSSSMPLTSSIDM